MQHLQYISHSHHWLANSTLMQERNRGRVIPNGRAILLWQGWRQCCAFSNACYVGLHARGEPHCDSYPEHSIAIVDLCWFCFSRKSFHSDLVCSSFFFCANSVSCLALYVAIANIYRGETGKQNLDMLLDILPNQDNAFRRHSSTPYLFHFTLPCSLGLLPSHLKGIGLFCHFIPCDHCV